MDSTMRRLMAVGFTMLLIAGCATSNVSDLPEVDLQIEQLPDSGFAVEDRGAVSIAYQISVRNRSTDVLTLRKVEMQTSGRSPYTLRNEPVTFNETIEPGKDVVTTFTMWSYSREQRSNIRRVVWVSGVAYFDSAKGNVKKVFTQSFREP